MRMLEQSDGGAARRRRLHLGQAVTATLLVFDPDPCLRFAANPALVAKIGLQSRFFGQTLRALSGK